MEDSGAGEGPAAQVRYEATSILAGVSKAVVSEAARRVRAPRPPGAVHTVSSARAHADTMLQATAFAKI